MSIRVEALVSAEKEQQKQKKKKKKGKKKKERLPSPLFEKIAKLER